MAPAIPLRLAINLALLGAAMQSCVARFPPPPLSPPSPQPARYSLIFFGDSLTDIGNDFKAAGVPDAKLYSNGRFSNGQIWADYLRQAVQKRFTVQVLNYAYGGATACANPAVEAAYPFVKNLTAQVAAFAADVRSNKARLANTRTLAFQFIGSDDMLLFAQSLAASNATATPEDLAALAARIVACRVQGAAALAAVPGVTDIVLIPLAAIHTYPVVPADLKDEVEAVQVLASTQLTAAVATLNAQLAANGSAARLTVLGNSTWIANVLTSIYPPFPFVEEPCFWVPGSPLNRSATVGVKGCRAVVNYYTFDQYHPTTRFHDWFVNKALLPRLQVAGLLPRTI